MDIPTGSGCQCWCFMIYCCVQMQAGFGNGALPAMGSPFPMGGQRGMEVMPQAYGGMQVCQLKTF